MFKNINKILQLCNHQYYCLFYMNIFKCLAYLQIRFTFCQFSFNFYILNKDHLKLIHKFPFKYHSTLILNPT